MQRVLASLGLHFLKCPLIQLEVLHAVAEVDIQNVLRERMSFSLHEMFVLWTREGNLFLSYLKTFTSAEFT